MAEGSAGQSRTRASDGSSMTRTHANDRRHSTLVQGASNMWSQAKINLQWEKGAMWQEISGGLGDLGTFIPLLVGMTVVNGLDLGTTLIATGLYNILTGALFGVPMPVQPQKSIAAVAISEDPLSIPQIMAAGIWVAAITLFLGATGLISAVNRAVPLPVVRGVQLGLGLSLATKGAKLIVHLSAGTPRPWLGLDGVLVGLAAVLFTLAASGIGEKAASIAAPTPREVESDLHSASAAAAHAATGRGASARSRAEAGGVEVDEAEAGAGAGAGEERRGRATPTALIVLICGVLLTVLREPGILRALRVGPSAPQMVAISGRDWRVGFWRGAVPQLPLTLLNSVVAVCQLSRDLFPQKRVGLAAVASSVGVLNLAGCWFGAMPVCHGAGGLAAQFRFGARSGASVAFLGGLKLLLGLLFGGSLLSLLQHFPSSLLGALLLFSGIELAMAARDQTSRKDSFLCFVTAVASLATNSSTGFIAGFLVAALINLRAHLLSADGSSALDVFGTFRSSSTSRYEQLPTAEQP
eukprot:jgi/Mesen1/3476/ME000195S02625